jgi:hypothetical protein
LIEGGVPHRRRRAGHRGFLARDEARQGGDDRRLVARMDHLYVRRRMFLGRRDTRARLEPSAVNYFGAWLSLVQSGLPSAGAFKARAKCRRHGAAALGSSREATSGASLRQAAVQFGFREADREIKNAK